MSRQPPLSQERLLLLAAMNPLAVPLSRDTEINLIRTRLEGEGRIAGVKSQREEDAEKEKSPGHSRVLEILFKGAIEARRQILAEGNTKPEPITTVAGLRKFEQATYTTAPKEQVSALSFASAVPSLPATGSFANQFQSITRDKPATGSFAAAAQAPIIKPVVVVPMLMDQRISAESSFVERARSRDGIHIDPNGSNAPFFPHDGFIGDASTKRPSPSKTRADFSHAATPRVPDAVPKITSVIDAPRKFEGSILGPDYTPAFMQ